MNHPSKVIMKSKFHIIVAAACLVMLTACGGGSKKAETVVVSQPAYAVKEVTVGTGTDKATLAENGDLVAVAYTAYLYDAAQPDGIGAKVESSVDIGATASPFVLGVGGTVGIGGTIPQGWDLAVPGMRVGGVRLATLPANLAYGAAAREAVKPVNGNTYEPIKANSPLVYRLQLVGVTKGPFTQPVVPPPTELKITEINAGTGAVAVAGKTASVRYTGWVYDGTRDSRKGFQFDTNVNTTPAKDVLKVVIDSSPLGVIAGFNNGIKDMKVGGKRTIIIPISLAYGASPPSGSNIPVNSSLVFDIELISVD
jgi:peptidylprolyl isomerase